MEATTSNCVPRVPWNKDKLTGQKPPLKLKEIWAIRIRLPCFTASFDASICSPCARMGPFDRTRRHRVWNAHNAPDQGIADLPPDEKPPCRTTSARSYQA
jgi:hypothetical protein